MSVIQIISFTANEKFLADPDSNRAALEYLRRMTGCLAVWHGFALENKKRAVIICSWNSMEDKDQMEDQKHYTAFLASLPTTLESSIRNDTAVFREFPNLALLASMTSIERYTFQDEMDQDSIDATFERINVTNAGLEEGYLDPFPSLPRVYWGIMNGETHMQIVMAGWESVEHRKALIEKIKINDPALKLMDHFADVMDVDPLHVTLIKTCPGPA